MSLHLDILLDQIFKLLVAAVGTITQGFAELIGQAFSQLGWWGQLSLGLFMILVGSWILYQLLRLVVFIMLRIVLPLAIIALTLMLLVILTS